MNSANRTHIIFLLLILSLPAARSKASFPEETKSRKEVREMIRLNDGWSYLEDDIPSFGDIAKTGQRWMPVVLPHTWNKNDVMDVTPGYRRGIGWYRRDIVRPPGNAGDRVLLYFEGVNMKAEVFVNGRRAGEHIGGYLGFEVDITPFLKNGSNTIHVKADNGIDPDLIPSQKSDFFLYGGISRNVWLKRVPALSITSLRISTPVVSATRASTTSTISLVNTHADRISAGIEVRLLSPAGEVVARDTQSVSVSAGQQSIAFELPEVKKPSLWSTTHPVLYTAVATVKVGGHVVDMVQERYGYRWFEFKEHGPFLLNGERILLRGTHRHEEWSGWGNALPDSLHRREMTAIKEMGANFVRLAHYPQSPEVYRACDELGLLVWDELPWCRGGVGGPVWKQNTRRMLDEMIRQNFNHPSIIIWSLGNEIDWLPDFSGGDNIDSLRSMLASLNAQAHQLDPGRVTATRRFDEGADLVDVHSPSIWMGWYASNGGYQNYGKAITDARRKFTHFLHAEYGGDSHVGRHAENRIGGDGMLTTAKGKEKMMPVANYGDWSESYIVDLFDWYLKTSEQSDSLTGTAQWIFKDFGTPLRPENPIPYVNQKGLCDLAGVPKDAYYVFKSYWTSSPKFCYVESHTWTERNGPSGTKRDIKVFSNCGEVELFVNRQSMGRRIKDIAKFPASGLLWQVDFPEGADTLLAVGWESGKPVAKDSLVVHYTFRQNGPADDFQLSSSELPNGNILVTAIAVDKNGQPCLDYNKRIYFSHAGGGHLLTGYGTRTRSNILEMASGKAYIELVPDPREQAIVEVRNQELKGAYIIIGGGKSSHGPGEGTKQMKRLNTNEN
jgi:beta-galactosidase